MKKLKAIISVLLVCALTAGILSSTVFASGALFGDVDLDGRVTAEDALIVLRYSAGISSLTDEQRLRADVTYDGDINSTDALRILLYLSGSISSLDRLGGEEGDDIII